MSDREQLRRGETIQSFDQWRNLVVDPSTFRTRPRRATLDVDSVGTLYRRRQPQHQSDLVPAFDGRENAAVADLRCR
jgi:hypothetical protein